MKYTIGLIWNFFWLFVGLCIAQDFGWFPDDPIKSSFTAMTTMVVADKLKKRYL